MNVCFTIFIILVVMNLACIEDFNNNDSSPSLIREIRDTSTDKRQDNKIKNKKRKKQRKSGKRKRLKYQGNSNSENSNETKKKKITGRKKTNTGVAKSKTQKKKSKNKKRNGQKKSERHQKGRKIRTKNTKEKERSNKSKKEKKRSKKAQNGKKVRKYSRKAKDKKKKEKKKTNKNHGSSQAKIDKVQIKGLDNSSLDSNTTDLRKKLTCDCDQPNKAAVKYFAQNRRFYDKYNFLEKKLDKISVFKSYASLLGKITKNGTVCTKAARVRRFVILHDTFCGSYRSPRCLSREHLLEH